MILEVRIVTNKEGETAQCKGDKYNTEVNYRLDLTLGNQEDESVSRLFAGLMN